MSLGVLLYAMKTKMLNPAAGGVRLTGKGFQTSR